METLVLATALFSFRSLDALAQKWNDVFVVEQQTLGLALNGLCNVNKGMVIASLFGHSLLGKFRERGAVSSASSRARGANWAFYPKPSAVVLSGEIESGVFSDALFGLLEPVLVRPLSAEGRGWILYRIELS